MGWGTRDKPIKGSRHSSPEAHGEETERSIRTEFHKRKFTDRTLFQGAGAGRMLLYEDSRRRVRQGASYVKEFLMSSGGK